MSNKILFLDIETAPIIAKVWGLFDQNISLNQIEQDWSILAWSAKWLGDKPSKMYYQDQRKAKNVNDDKKLLQGIWKLLDEADIICTQNGRAFDAKKLNARFILNGMKPPSSYKHIDTKVIASKVFGFTSNKLEYMTSKLCKKYKKLSHKKFPGFELWTECLKGNQAAWKEMERYNKYDVLSLEELYLKLQPWDKATNLNNYTDHIVLKCNCGNKSFNKHGFFFSGTGGKFQRFVCKVCGWETRSKVNLFSQDKKDSLKK